MQRTALNFRLLTGQTFQLPTDDRWTVVQLKHLEQMQGQCQRPPECIRLIHKGKEFDDALPLSTYELSDGDTIMVLFRSVPGGQKEQKPGLDQLIQAWEICVAAKEDLMQLKQYDTAFILDDSGSMNSVEVTDGVQRSRWQELQATIGPMIEFATYFDDDGADVHFLNRASVEGVSDPKDPRLFERFQEACRYKTPLTSTLRRVVGGHRSSKPLLLVIATDGEPSEEGGIPAFVQAVRDALAAKPALRIAFLACTQDDEAVGWLNRLDDDPQVGSKIDVCDDYTSEKAEVMRKGQWPHFYKADYIVKCLLGPICSKYDQADR